MCLLSKKAHNPVSVPWALICRLLQTPESYQPPIKAENASHSLVPDLIPVYAITSAEVVALE